MRRMNTVTVVGVGGLMGSQIAAHLANCGLTVFGVDRVPDELTQGEFRYDPRNEIGLTGIARAVHAKPVRGFYVPVNRNRITVGNTSDDLATFVADSDLVIEAVFEDLQLKREIHEQIDAARTPGSVITSNTSGLPLSEILDGRSDDFRAHFVNMHWFNPPRLMELIELIAGDDTDPAIVDALEGFCNDRLGKVVVHANDVPGFVANRIGPFPLGVLLCEYALEHGVEYLDYIFGKHSGASAKPFVTADLVGLGTLVDIFDNMVARLPDDDPAKQVYAPPEFLREMVAAGLTGAATKTGFYRGRGREVVDLPFTGEFGASRKKSFSADAVTAAKRAHSAGDAASAQRALYLDEGTVGEIFRSVTNRWILYAAEMAPIVSRDGSPAAIDLAMNRGYNQMGPFQRLDAIGVDTVIERLGKDGLDVPALLSRASESGSVYGVDSSGRRTCLDLGSGSPSPVPVPSRVIAPEILIESGRLDENDSAVMYDLSEGVLGIRITSKSGTIDEQVIPMVEAGLERARDPAHIGLVIHGQHEAQFAPVGMFSAGANLELLIGLNQWYLHGAADEKAEAERLIEEIVSRFQAINYGIKYSPVPVVVAKSGIAIGGGLELGFGGRHRVDREARLGLVEVGAGLIPGGGGTVTLYSHLHEMLSHNGTRRADPAEVVEAVTRLLGNPREAVSDNAYHAVQMGYLTPRDEITAFRPRLLSDARDDVVRLHREGYMPPVEPRLVRDGKRSYDKVAIGTDLFDAMGLLPNAYMCRVLDTLVWVLSGGDEGRPGLTMSEKEMLRVERQGFMRLALSEPAYDDLTGDPGFALFASASIFRKRGDALFQFVKACKDGVTKFFETVD